MARRQSRQAQRRLEREMFGVAPPERKQRRRTVSTPSTPSGIPGNCWACGNCCWPVGEPWACPHCGVIYPPVACSESGEL